MSYPAAINHGGIRRMRVPELHALEATRKGREVGRWVWSGGRGGTVELV